jgi:hypothetical protein
MAIDFRIVMPDCYALRQGSLKYCPSLNKHTKGTFNTNTKLRVEEVVIVFVTTWNMCTALQDIVHSGMHCRQKKEAQVQEDHHFTIGARDCFPQMQDNQRKTRHKVWKYPEICHNNLIPPGSWVQTYFFFHRKTFSCQPHTLLHLSHLVSESKLGCHQWLQHSNKKKQHYLHCGKQRLSVFVCCGRPGTQWRTVCACWWLWWQTRHCPRPWCVRFQIWPSGHKVSHQQSISRNAHHPKQIVVRIIPFGIG